MPRKATVKEVISEEVLVDTAPEVIVEAEPEIEEVKIERPSKALFKNAEGGLISAPIVLESDSLYNTLGQKVPFEDYVFGDETVPVYETITKQSFDMLGRPVDQEDLIEIFNQFFNPKDGFLFYKDKKKEIYTFIVPVKYSKMSKQNGSMNGDMQIHSVSFMSHGGINIDLFKIFLKKLVKNVKY